jgi:hypothetical protein
MGISLKTHKLLWARSGGKCALCKNDLILDPTGANDDLSVVGDEAHIIARKESFTRGDYDSLTPEQRDQYSNLILLCKVHHKQVDDQPTQFTVEKLREMKREHEEGVKSLWTEADERKQSDEIIYASYIDEWEKQADLANWRNTSSWLSSASELTLPKKWYEDQKEFLLWLIARIWPGRYPSLENSLLNYGAVLRDFLNVFDKYVEPSKYDNAFLSTRRFYKITNFDPVRYHELVEQYNAHEGLVCDLFFELTRSANYVCDKVRESIFPGYRLKEGVLIIERHSVGPHLETIRARLEYRNEERGESPYPGLEEFKTIRYSRDYALAPEEPDVDEYMGKEE